MATKVTLRTLGAIDLGAPTVEQARIGLGGRAQTDPRAGERVWVTDAHGGRVEGVVVFASATERDVWIGEGRFQRVAPSACEPTDGSVPVDDRLREIAIDARRFALLAEDEPVRFLDRRGRESPGTLVEKCRYGALIVVPGAKVIAVSFRRIWPATLSS